MEPNKNQNADVNVNTDDEMEEFSVFTVTDQDGNDVEMAIVDEFKFENEDYIVCAQVEGDRVSEDGVYIYKALFEESGDEFTVEEIDDEEKYNRVVDYYTNME